ncbi:MAG: cyclic nucleotide-binding domain-containing protein [Desulfobacterales bacterium]|nr:MAG: cyclic nucleotide-binding domain-containing protein [Desulfobacterales bacterium]
MIGLDFLEKVEIFQNLDKEQLTGVQGCCQARQYELGARLFGEGEYASHIHIVKRGQVDLRFDLPGRPTSEKNTISSISEYKVFGWSCLVPPYKYSLSAYCTAKTCEVASIEKASLDALFEKDPGLGYRVLSNMAIVIGKRFKQLEKLASGLPFSLVKINVHMGTCGIAAGAREVMGALMDEMARTDRQDIRAESSGCLGRCSTEPNVTVEIEGADPVVYQKMNPARMRQVFIQHILGGRIQTEFVLE